MPKDRFRLRFDDIDGEGGYNRNSHGYFGCDEMRNARHKGRSAVLSFLLQTSFFWLANYMLKRYQQDQEFHCIILVLNGYRNYTRFQCGI